MRTIRTVAELRSALAQPRRDGLRVGLVPTMGAFHEGHLSLIRRARAQCDVVVVSLFVNPTQFNDPSDLSAYPRKESRDAAMAADLGADYLFMPSQEEVYPPGFATTVLVAGLTDRLEGAHRGRAHFDGVATVVTKLFNMVGPDVAYFGQKDAQQAIVVGRLVRDLDIPVRIEVCPTIREPDGLAMSSRNVHLSAAERDRATALQRALNAVQAVVAAGERDAMTARNAGLAELTRAQIEPDYLELVETDTLAPVERIAGDVLAVVAARVGATRLIDNQPIQLHDPRAPDEGAHDQSINLDHEVATPRGAPTT
jgi:pantoate--beta-alanine ligase